MKPLTKNLLITAIACPVLGLLIGAATQQSIRWITDICWDVQPDGSYTQPGKRSDGVAVWREIHPATTNSPAEDNTIKIELGGTNVWLGTNLIIQPWYPYTITNIPMSNFFNLNGTMP